MHPKTNTMQRIIALDPQSATGESKETFDAIKSQFGMVPNMMRTMGHSNAVLAGMLSFSNALSAGSIDHVLREQIALLVANITGCEYCNTSHSYVSEKILKMDAETINLAKEGRALDMKSNAALQFVNSLVSSGGNITDEEFSRLIEAGFTEQAICEIIAHTGFNIFTNYFCKTMKVKPEFPISRFVERSSSVAN